MLDKLFSLFQKKTALMVLQEIIGLVEKLLCFFEEDYLKNGHNDRNAAIDALVELLESFKTKTYETSAQKTSK